jgi:hypothetical protein
LGLQSRTAEIHIEASEASGLDSIYKELLGRFFGRNFNRATARMADFKDAIMDFLLPLLEDVDSRTKSLHGSQDQLQSELERLSAGLYCDHVEPLLHHHHGIELLMLQDSLQLPPLTESVDRLTRTRKRVFEVNLMLKRVLDRLERVASGMKSGTSFSDKK